MSLTSFNKRQTSRSRRQCDRCGKLAKDTEAGTYPRPNKDDGKIKNRDRVNLDVEWCDECWKIIQAEANSRKIA